MFSQSEIKDISCNMCLKDFESNLQFKSHMMKQHKEDPVTCEVEATHSKFDKFIKVHNYQVRNVESNKAGEHLLKAVKHFNSYNL